MALDDICLEAEEKMDKAVNVLREGLRAIRTGRATTALVDRIKVDYYGTPTPLLQIAHVSAPEPQMIVIRSYDPGALKEIERAIQQSSLGINPVNDGKFIRIVIPPLSEERRKQLASQVRKMGEESKIAIRNVRRDANRHIDRAQKESEISEDDAYRGKEDVQETTHEYEGKVGELVDAKATEIMEF